LTFDQKVGSFEIVKTALTLFSTTGNFHMNNSFANIDSNRIASKKQIWAVANHFAAIQATVPSERYGLTKVFNAILNKHHADQDSLMTHGDIQEFFEYDLVPKQFADLIQAKKSTKPKAPKKAAKPKAAKIEPEIEEFIAKVEPKKPRKVTQSNSVASKMNARIESIEGRFDSLESKVGDIEAGLAMILEAVQKK
tara:strand:- start:459 stop:1043 length:585 start_codon:yes stop_codon:yes gene_type:complete